ncbi:MAG: FadR/GntR family transcriptional regulator [Candidatus Limnocylindria bacterium]
MSARATDAAGYQPLARTRRLSDRLAEEIERRIVEGELAPGTRLPAERELGDAFKVSRTIIREAVRSLIAKGLVEVRPGAGTVVRGPSMSMVSDALAFVMHAASGRVRIRDAHEIRWTLEPQIAALAAERRTEEDLRSIERELETMRESPEQWEEADVRFHRALAQATQNPLFGVVLDSLHPILREVRALGNRLRDTRTTGIEHHTAIFDAVRAADPDRAREAMRAHLREAETRMRRGAKMSQASWGLPVGEAGE